MHHFHGRLIPTPATASMKKMTLESLEPIISPAYREIIRKHAESQKRIAMRGFKTN